VGGGAEEGERAAVGWGEEGGRIKVVTLVGEGGAM